jgi:hypothetical protein
MGSLARRQNYIGIIIKKNPSLQPIAVAARSKARTVFARSNNGDSGFESHLGIDVCVCVCVCVFCERFIESELKLLVKA